jgi:hypothetical protein
LPDPVRVVDPLQLNVGVHGTYLLLVKKKKACHGMDVDGLNKVSRF